MRLTAFCSTHGRQCSLRTTKRHIAGSSCKPWSRKGAGLKAGDPEIVYTLAWLGHILLLEHDEILSENVKQAGSSGLGSASVKAKATAAGDYDEAEGPSRVVDAGLGSLFLRFLSPIYEMETTVLDPSMLGDPFSREREFVKMIHKGKRLTQSSPLSRFQRRFFKACSWGWKSALYYLLLFKCCKHVFCDETVMRLLCRVIFSHWNSH